MLKALLRLLKKNDRVDVFQTQRQGEKEAVLPADDVMKELSMDPQQIQRMHKMSDHLQLMLRMAAMDLLREEEKGFVMEACGQRVRMPDAKTLFEAYLVLEEMYGEDWFALEDALNAPWIREAINMVLEPEKYIGIWQGLRMRVISQALPMLEKYGGSERVDERNSKFFTVLCVDICEKVIDTLRRGDEKTP